MSSVSVQSVSSASASRGLAWSFASAIGSAAYMIPWKLGASAGSRDITVLLLLAFAAMFSTGTALFNPGEGPRAWPTRHEWWLSSQLAVLALTGNWASAIAIEQLSPAVLSVLQRSEVLVVALLAWLFLGERVNRSFWVGAAVAAIGLLLIQKPENHSAASSAGVMFGLLSAVLFGTMNVLSRRSAQHMDPVRVNATRLWLAVVLWFGVHGFPETLWHISTHVVICAALAAFFGPFLSRVCLMYALRYVEARVAVLTILLAPVMALGLGYLWFGDLPSALQLLGGALMLIGIVVPALSERWRVERVPS